jgi:hypothetical protein
MTSTSEIGHAKNVAYLHELIDFCSGYGASYSPSKNEYKVTELQTLETDSNAALNFVTAKRTAFNIKVNDRKAAFADLRSLSTRLVNALQATNASKALISDAKGYNKKIQGSRSAAIETPTDPNAPVPATISVSQVSRDQLIQHFIGLIAVITAEPSYNPNEADLKITALNTKKNLLITTNNAVSAAYADYSNAIIARNKTLYLEDTGLVPIALGVKKYVKSIFGATSAEYAQVKGLPFRKLK